ncbi:hypothetical protein MNBD_PLANCTO02-795, partial [hydrothermal vent metagenome]
MNQFFLRIFSCRYVLILWCCVGIPVHAQLKELTSTSYDKELLTDNSVDEISYEISMAKKNYRYGERKVVTSTIKNIGKRTIRVRLPTAINGIVSYHVFQNTPKGQKEAGESRDDLWMYAPAGIVELAPGKSCSTACEVSIILTGGTISSPSFGGLGLDPGKYVLKANYHLVVEGEEYLTKIVPAAKELSFTVRKITAEEQKELSAFLAGFGRLFPFKIQGVRAEGSAKLLEQFLKDYPDSQYQLSGYSGLRSFYYDPKDMTKSYAAWKQAHDKGLYNQLCEELLDYYRDNDTGTLIPAGKFQEAIDFLKGSRRPDLIIFQNDLEKSLKKMQAGKKKNNSTKEIPKEKKVDPPQTSKPKVTETNKTEPPVATNDSYKWTIVTITFLVLLALIAAWKFKSKKT